MWRERTHRVARGQRAVEPRVALRFIVAAALAACLVGSSALVGEARIHETLDSNSEAIVVVRPASPVVNLVWEADVSADGGAFRLFTGRKYSDMQFFAEVEALSGQRSYRVQQQPVVGIATDSGPRIYDLRFRGADGSEVSLASIIVMVEDLAPAVNVEVFSPRQAAVLGSSDFRQEDREWLPLERRRIRPGHWVRCPPTPPP